MRFYACVAGFLALAFSAMGTEEEEAPAFAPEKIEQLVAPIALYPDDLVSQILVASTYPLEVIEAARWYKSSVKLEGDELAKALRSKSWDPSVTSLVNFPDVLEMMDRRLDWMQDLGNAFLAQQTDVMAAIQKLRKKAQEEGNLKSSKEVKVEAEDDAIVIVPADPKVIYVPVYNPTIVYGAWPYPAYPPYYYHPPYWKPRPTPYAFAAGVAVGVAWGYAWGSCSWRHSSVNININRNVNLNRNINREKYARQYSKAGVRNGEGAWKHNPSHRRGVQYPSAKTAQQYGRGPSPKASSREAYRGHATPNRSARPTSQPTRQPTARPTRQPTAQPTPSRTRQPTQSTGGFHQYNQRSAVQRQSSRGYSSRHSAGPRGGGGGGRRR